MKNVGEEKVHRTVVSSLNDFRVNLEKKRNTYFDICFSFALVWFVL